MASDQREMLSVKNAIERTVHAYFTTHAKTESRTKMQDVVEDVRKYVAALYVSGQIGPDFTVGASEKAIDVRFTFNGHYSATTYMVPYGFDNTAKTFVQAVKIAEKTPMNQAELEDMWANRKLESDNRLIAEIKANLQRAAEQFLFEPNDRLTRGALAAAFTTYLSGQFIDDYTVVCDETNNTSARIDNGELWADVAIKLHGTEQSFIYLPVCIESNIVDLTEETNDGTPVTVQVVPAMVREEYIDTSFSNPTGRGSKVTSLPVSALNGMGPVGYNSPFASSELPQPVVPDCVAIAQVTPYDELYGLPNKKVMTYLDQVKAELTANRAAKAFDAAKVD